MWATIVVAAKTLGKPFGMLQEKYIEDSIQAWPTTSQTDSRQNIFAASTDSTLWLHVQMVDFWSPTPTNLKQNAPAISKNELAIWSCMYIYIYVHRASCNIYSYIHIFIFINYIVAFLYLCFFLFRGSLWLGFILRHCVPGGSRRVLLGNPRPGPLGFPRRGCLNPGNASQ